MSCKKCDETEGFGVAYYRWKTANIGMIGCDEHVREVFDALNTLQRSKDINYLDVSCPTCGHVPKSEKHLCTYEAWHNIFPFNTFTGGTKRQIIDAVESLLIENRLRTVHPTYETGITDFTSEKSLVDDFKTHNCDQNMESNMCPVHCTVCGKEDTHVTSGWIVDDKPTI